MFGIIIGVVGAVALLLLLSLVVAVRRIRNSRVESKHYTTEEMMDENAVDDGGEYYHDEGGDQIPPTELVMAGNGPTNTPSPASKKPMNLSTPQPARAQRNGMPRSQPMNRPMRMGPLAQGQNSLPQGIVQLPTSLAKAMQKQQQQYQYQNNQQGKNEGNGEGEEDINDQQPDVDEQDSLMESDMSQSDITTPDSPAK